MEVLTSSSQRYSQDFPPVAIEVERPSGFIFLSFILIHIPLALIMLRYPLFSTIHAYTVLGFGVIACLIGRFDIAAAAAAYITGAEVLWRMTEASIFWEYGKYATLLICGIGVLRTGLRKTSIPFLYFLLLVPSTILTAESSSFERARQELSFNLSGPLALFVSICFFSGKTWNKQELGRILVALVAPIIGIVTIASYSTFSASKIYFTDESNPITSGGFGPNQVSAMLGLGALVLALFIISIRASKFFKIIAGILGLVLLSQSLLTFSRGGSYLALTSIAAAVLIVVRRRQIISVLAGTILIAAIFIFGVLPWMNSFTGGTLEERYSDLRTSGRVDIVRDDLRIFQEHPFIGVGPGKASGYRILYRGAVAHTEFSRMLAEHGMLGLAAIILLIIIAIRNIRSATQREEKAITVSLLLWSISFMFINAMRLVAPAFLFGLTSSQIAEANEEEEEDLDEDFEPEEDEQ